MVSDRPLAELRALIAARFGAWKGEGPAGGKVFPAAVPAPRQRIVLIDRKDSPQSVITAGMVLPVRGTDNTLDLDAANDVLGGTFLSRLNMDLRETKGWSYGARSNLVRRKDRMLYLVSAPVQADKTGASIAALRQDIAKFTGTDGVTAAELERTVNGNIRALPGNFQTAGAVLAALQNNALYQRPDDYYAGLPVRYRAQTAAALDLAARRAIDPGALLWVVVGDAAVVRPQLEALDLSVEQIAAP